MENNILNVRKQIVAHLTRWSCCALRVHPAGPHYLYQLEPEGRNVVLDLVDVVLGDALVLRLALLLRHVAAHQVPHHAVVAQVTLAGLTHTSLEGKKEKSI